jgi:hypothetical protein
MKSSGYGRDRSAGASEMVRAAALIEREELLNDELRFVNEVSRRQERWKQNSPRFVAGFSSWGFPPLPSVIEVPSRSP